MLKKLIALTLLAGGAVFGQVSIGIRIGPPPPPRVVRVTPVRPGPDFMWVDGYWTRPPYEGARWVGPRHEGGQYYQGYWEGERGRRDHDHKWDRRRERDWRHNN